jgi:hypothetical protein
MPRKAKVTEPENIEFVFKYACVSCSMNPEAFDDETQKKAYDSRTMITKEIHIDRTYVDSPKTMFENTFLTEEGWIALCQLVKDTNYGKKVNASQQEILSGAYKKMIICYVEQIFNDLDWDTENMVFSMADNAKFMVEYYPGTNEYMTYPGRWQTWKK